MTNARALVVASLCGLAHVLLVNNHVAAGLLVMMSLGGYLGHVLHEITR